MNLGTPPAALSVKELYIMRFQKHRGVLTLCLGLLLLIAIISPLLAQPVNQEVPCGERPECYEATPTVPPDKPVNRNGDQATSWEGFTDGRLNPEMAEYYSVWCRNDMIQVWRAVPNSELLAEFSMADTSTFYNGVPNLRGNNVIVTRMDDTIMLSGSNGNLAPEYGRKIFSLSECYVRNGSTPPTLSPTFTPFYPPDQLSPMQQTQVALDPGSMCMDPLYVAANMVACGDAANPDSSESIFWELIDQICRGYDIVPSVFTMVFVLRSRRKRKRRLLAEQYSE
jgi:hypothetical protein